MIKTVLEYMFYRITEIYKKDEGDDADIRGAVYSVFPFYGFSVTILTIVLRSLGLLQTPSLTPLIIMGVPYAVLTLYILRRFDYQKLARKYKKKDPYRKLKGYLIVLSHALSLSFFTLDLFLH